MPCVHAEQFFEFPQQDEMMESEPGAERSKAGGSRRRTRRIDNGHHRTIGKRYRHFCGDDFGHGDRKVGNRVSLQSVFLASCVCQYKKARENVKPALFPRQITTGKKVFSIYRFRDYLPALAEVDVCRHLDALAGCGIALL